MGTAIAVKHTAKPVTQKIIWYFTNSAQRIGTIDLNAEIGKLLSKLAIRDHDARSRMLDAFSASETLYYGLISLQKGFEFMEMLFIRAFNIYTNAFFCDVTIGKNEAKPITDLLVIKSIKRMFIELVIKAYKLATMTLNCGPNATRPNIVFTSKQVNLLTSQVSPRNFLFDFIRKCGFRWHGCSPKTDT